MPDQVFTLLSGLAIAVVGALCAAFIPLLQRARRTQQEVELGLKEAERIEKILNVSAKLKADYGGQTDISRVNARLRLVIANMASDEEKSGHTASTFGSSSRRGAQKAQRGESSPG